MEEDADGYEKDLRPEDMVPDEDYYSDDEHFEQKPKEKPVGPPLEMEIPLCPPPGRPDRVMSCHLSQFSELLEGLNTLRLHTETSKSMMIRSILTYQLIY